MTDERAPAGEERLDSDDRETAGQAGGLDAEAEKEQPIREYLRGIHRCIPPHGSLDDLLHGDATLLEVREALAARLSSASGPEAES